MTHVTSSNNSTFSLGRDYIFDPLLSIAKQSFLSPVYFWKYMYHILGEAVGKKYMRNHVICHVSALILVNSVSYYIENEMGNRRREMMDAYSKLSRDDGAKVEEELWNLFLGHVYSYAFSLSQILFSTILNHFIERLSAFRLRRKLSDDLTALYWVDQNALGLSLDEKSRSIIALQDEDIFNVAFKGAEGLTSAASKLSKAVFSLVIISHYSSSIRIKGYDTRIPNFLAYTLAYAFITQIGTGIFVYFLQPIRKIIFNNKAFFDQSIVNIQQNIKEITQGFGQYWTHNATAKELSAIRKFVDTSEWIKLGMETWKDFHTNIVRECLQYLLLGHSIFNQSIPYTERGATFVGLTNLFSLFAWPTENATLINAVEVSLENIKFFLDKIASINAVPSKMLYSSKPGKNLQITNLTISIKDDVTLIKNFSEIFHPKNSILIGGKSGSGKSSFIQKIMGITGDDIEGKGQITYPDRKNVFAITQFDFMPKKTLLQLLCGYTQLPEDEKELEEWKERIYNLATDDIQLILPFTNKQGESKTYKELFMEKITDTSIDWSRLSGGQRKQVKFTALCHQLSLAVRTNSEKSSSESIFKTGSYRFQSEEERVASFPVILLDEAFNGIDNEKISIIQEFIKKYVPNAIIFSIDHTGQDKTGFYNTYLHLNDGQIVKFSVREEFEEAKKGIVTEHPNADIKEGKKAKEGAQPLSWVEKLGKNRTEKSFIKMIQGDVATLLEGREDDEEAQMLCKEFLIKLKARKIQTASNTTALG